LVEPNIFQREAAERLKSVLSTDDVIVSWQAFAGEGRRIYQPVVDIAVGPYATGNVQYLREYDVMARNHQQLIDRWVTEFLSNWQAVIGNHYWALPPRTPGRYMDFIGQGSNRNARCFIAVEIENETSRKHLMGSIINAGALGRIGILVTWQDKVLRAAIRMRTYFDYLRSAGKRTFNMGNVIIVTNEQLANSLEMQL